jgi:hypothetical protein
MKFVLIIGRNEIREKKSNNKQASSVNHNTYEVKDAIKSMRIIMTFNYPNPNKHPKQKTKPSPHQKMCA